MAFSCCNKDEQTPTIVTNYEEEIEMMLDEWENDNRSFGMVRQHDNVDEDVACISIEKAEEYVKKYNKLAGEEKCFVDKDIWILLNNA